MFRTISRGFAAATLAVLAATPAQAAEIWGRVCSTDPGADCGPSGCSVDITYFLPPRGGNDEAGPWYYGRSCDPPFTFPFTVTIVTARGVTLVATADLSSNARIRYWGVGGSFEGLLLDWNGADTYTFALPLAGIREGLYDHCNVVDPTPQSPE